MGKFTVEVDQDLKPIIPRYLEIRREELALLEKAIQNENFEEIRMLGHKLKGTGAAYGFMELTEIGRFIEDNASEAIMGEIPQKATRIKEYLDNVEIKFVEIDE